MAPIPSMMYSVSSPVLGGLMGDPVGLGVGGLVGCWVGLGVGCWVAPGVVVGCWVPGVVVGCWVPGVVVGCWVAPGVVVGCWVPGVVVGCWVPGVVVGCWVGPGVVVVVGVTDRGQFSKRNSMRMGKPKSGSMVNSSGVGLGAKPGGGWISRNSKRPSGRFLTRI